MMGQIKKIPGKNYHFSNKNKVKLWSKNREGTAKPRKARGGKLNNDKS